MACCSHCMYNVLSARPCGAYPMIYSMAVVGDKSEDCTLQDLQQKEAPEAAKRAALRGKFAPLHDIPHWQQGWVEKIPDTGGPAPDGIIHRISIPFQELKLHEALRAMKTAESDMVGLVFFSATCPVFNSMVHDIAPLFEENGIPCLYVYIAEFHTTDGIPNSMVPQIDMPRTLKERARVATNHGLGMLVDALNKEDDEEEDVQIYMASMDGSLEMTYEARPWRIYVIDAKTMTIAYKSGPGPMNCKAKLRDLTEFLEEER
eukprot:TRINITY_DN53934_c0_g1_i1.p1 TRINITY_DN53934_c0_g1~~TRINITY_DN53934_c0_g1_i1.p1  ORF type:complete len:261 (-),score=70.93 TRINITY_DN53934_c0_g1_i1:23-805(-)